MASKNIKSALFLLAICLVAACQKEVSLDLKDQHQPRLFIESVLYVGEKPQVFLSESTSFFSEKVTPQEVFVRNAEVEISEGGNTWLLQKDSTIDKFRCRWNPFYGWDFAVEKDKTYQLRVRYAGKEYEAETSTSLRPITVDEVEYTPEFFDVYGGHDGVIVRFRDTPGAGDFYRFEMDRWIDTSRYHAHVLDVLTQNNCVGKDEKFFVRDLGRSIFSDEGIDGTPFELYLEVSFEYRQGDTATIFMQTLDENAAVFYRDLDKQLESIRNPFVEPAFIHSNIPGAFGVFGAAVKSPAMTFIYPQDNP